MTCTKTYAERYTRPSTAQAQHYNDFGTLVPKETAQERWEHELIARESQPGVADVRDKRTGDNIPGKTHKPLVYLGGVDSFYKFLMTALSIAMRDSTLSRATACKLGGLR